MKCFYKLQFLKCHLEGPGGIREMVAIALPMVVSHACETAMTFTDRLFLSRLGSEYMAASMGGGLSAFVMMTFFFGLIGYSTALVAQYLGSGQKEKCASTLTQCAVIALLAFPIILALRPLAVSYFKWMGVSDPQLLLQTQYFNILIYGVLFSLLRHSFSSYFSGIGRTKIVMIAAIISMLVNVIANYTLIFGKFGFPALGITGAAIGTVFSSFIGFAVIAYAYFARENRMEFEIMVSFRFDLKVMHTLLRFGTPAGLEFFLNLLAFNVMVFLFHSQGANIAAAITIVFNWDMVSFLPMIGINIGVISLVGRYMGSGNPDLAHRSTWSGLKLAWIYSFFVLIAFACFPHYLVSVFHPTELQNEFQQNIAPMAITMLRLAALYVMADAMFLVFGGALRGAGDTLWAMVTSVLFHWILVAVLFVMLNLIEASPAISWLTLCLIFIVFSFVFYLRYKGGKWRKIKVVGQEISVQGADAMHETQDL
ncbi:MAG: MATE family efflux transporter [Gammaproteobacteria bacterium]|nr:MAG: MATE family efflux transporter [Gammaproteobacteria bacterium]